MKPIEKSISTLTDLPLKGEIQELELIMTILRDKEFGCPWDKEQDHSSIRSYLIEECFEAVEAIDSKVTNDIVSELGDVLLQVIFHAQIGKENGTFTLTDIIKSISNKMIRRHPHVFSNITVENSDEVLKNWNSIKESEKSESENKDLFSEKLKKLPNSLPALLKAERIGEKSAQVNFDWNNIKDVLKKVEEEMQEIKVAFQDLDQSIINSTKPAKNSNPSSEIALKTTALGTEIGDAIFSLTQLARWLNLSAENLTRECCERFIERLNVIEANFEKNLLLLDEKQKSAAWSKAKEIIRVRSE